MTPPKPPHRDIRIDKHPHPRAISAPIEEADSEDTANHDVVPIERADIRTRLGTLEKVVGDVRSDVSFIKGKMEILVPDAAVKTEIAKLEIADREKAREAGFKRWQIMIAMVAPVVAALGTYLATH